VAGGRIPAQRLWAAGGRGTVRGYAFHRYVGNLYAGGGLELRRPVRYPFLSVELFADVGWLGLEGRSAEEAVAVWKRVGDAARSTRGPLVGVGGGVGLVFDILWIELARGVTQKGAWELVVRVRPEFWPWL
jgi:hemolysin activation/secretion protein